MTTSQMPTSMQVPAQLVDIVLVLYSDKGHKRRKLINEFCASCGPLWPLPLLSMLRAPEAAPAALNV
jgi:hypothetical protein